jgi:hypothetical protein
VPLLAVVSTVEYDRRVGLVNVSRTGVQLTSPDLPREGEEVIFRADAVESCGRVVWSRNGQCGIAFEEPISADEVEQLQVEANLSNELPFLSFGSDPQAQAS